MFHWVTCPFHGLFIYVNGPFVNMNSGTIVHFQFAKCVLIRLRKWSSGGSWARMQSCRITSRSAFQPSPILMSFWILTERIRSLTPAAEMSLLRRAAGLSLSRTSSESSEWKYSFAERRQLRWFGIWSGCLLGAFRWRLSGHVQVGENPREDSELAWGIIYLIWLGNALGSNRKD